MRFLQLLTANSQGIICLIGALAFLTISDSIIKWLSPSLPLHEITLFRSLFALPLVFVFIYLEGGVKILKTRRPALHFLRGSMLLLANMFFFLALASMPLAETVSLFYTAPLFICLLSRPVLGEKVGLVRWLMILFGLIGVVVMLRPGSEVFRAVSLLPIFAALSYAAMQMMTRKLGMQERASTLSFYIQLSFIVISSSIGFAIGRGELDRFDNVALEFLFRAWSWPDAGQLQLLLLCGIMVAFGSYLISQAYRLSQASAVAPFEYSSLPFALLAGYYFWGDWPDMISFIGSAFIISSGLIIVYLENRKKNRKPLPKISQEI
ncbi:MAG: drug/metabolite transporter (DMT)-like permease [Planctomycetota bacterium]